MPQSSLLPQPTQGLSCVHAICLLSLTLFGDLLLRFPLSVTTPLLLLYQESKVLQKVKVASVLTVVEDTRPTASRD